MFVFNNHRKGFVIRPIFCTLLASMEFYPSTVISVPWLHICWQTIVMTATCRYLFCRHRHIGYCSWTLFLRPFHCVMLSKTLSFLYYTELWCVVIWQRTNWQSPGAIKLNVRLSILLTDSCCCWCSCLHIAIETVTSATSSLKIRTIVVLPYKILLQVNSIVRSHTENKTTTDHNLIDCT